MKHRILAGLLWWFLFTGPAQAHGWDLGVSAEFVDAVDAPYLEDGIGFHLGYEFIDTDNLRLGVQMHYIDGSSRAEDLYFADEMSFSSLAGFVTLRPRGLPLFVKLGRARVEYTTLFERRQASGLAWGAGLAFGDDYWRLHVLDYERYELDGIAFNTFSVTLTIILVP